MQRIAEKWQGITVDFWHAFRITEDLEGFLGLMGCSEFLRMVEVCYTLQSLTEDSRKKWQGITVDVWHALRITEDPEDFLGLLRIRKFLRMVETY